MQEAIKLVMKKIFENIKLCKKEECEGEFSEEGKKLVICSRWWRTLGLVGNCGLCQFF